MQSSEPDVKMRILLAAKELFAKQGYDATSVRQICEQACANVALVSYHFGGKENVFHALFEQFFPVQRSRELAPLVKDPVIGLQILIREVTLYRLSEPDMVQLLQHEIAVHSERIETIRQFVFPTWIILREILQRGKEQGKFHFRSLDNVLLSVINTLLLRNRAYYFEPLLTEGEHSDEALITDLTQFIMGGLFVSQEDLKKNVDK